MHWRAGQGRDAAGAAAGCSGVRVQGEGRAPSAEGRGWARGEGGREARVMQVHRRTSHLLPAPINASLIRPIMPATTGVAALVPPETVSPRVLPQPPNTHTGREPTQQKQQSDINLFCAKTAQRYTYMAAAFRRGAPIGWSLPP